MRGGLPAVPEPELRTAMAAALAFIDAVDDPQLSFARDGLRTAQAIIDDDDLHAARLSLAAASMALQRMGRRARDSDPGAWERLISTSLLPLAEANLRIARAGRLLEPAVAEEIERRLPVDAPAFYRGDPGGERWALVECVLRLHRVSAFLRSAPAHQPWVARTRGAIAAQLARMVRELVAETELAYAPGQTDGPGGGSRAEDLLFAAVRYEAFADVLVTDESRHLTVGLRDRSYLEEHRRAVGEFLQRPQHLPVLVVSRDDWLVECLPSRDAAFGLTVADQCILVSRRIGEQATAHRDRGVLNATILHELIHAAQRPAAALWSAKPAWRSGLRAFLEGLTEWGTREILRADAAAPRCPWSTGYRPGELDVEAYRGFVAVCEGFADAASEPGVLRRLCLSGRLLGDVADLLGVRDQAAVGRALHDSMAEAARVGDDPGVLGELRAAAAERFAALRPASPPDAGAAATGVAPAAAEADQWDFGAAPATSGPASTEMEYRWVLAADRLFVGRSADCYHHDLLLVAEEQGFVRDDAVCGFLGDSDAGLTFTAYRSGGADPDPATVRAAIAAWDAQDRPLAAVAP